MGPGRHCPPRHPTHSDPSALKSNGILRRGEQYITGRTLRYVNGSKYGLQGCVFTRDIDRAIRLVGPIII